MTATDQFSVRKLYEDADRAAAKTGGGGISSPGFVSLCKTLNLCEPQGSVEVGIAQAAHQKHRQGGNKRLMFQGFCNALIEVLMVARAFQAALAEGEGVDDAMMSAARASLGRIDTMMEQIKEELEAGDKQTAKQEVPLPKAYVPTYKNWMSNKDPSPLQKLPDIQKSATHKAPPRVQVPARHAYQAGHSDEHSPPAYPGRARDASQRQSAHATASSGDNVMRRLVNRIAEMEDKRFDAMGGEAHLHNISSEEIARKLQQMEMRLVRAEGQLQSRQSRWADADKRFKEADDRHATQDERIAKLQEKLEELELQKLEDESNISILSQKLDKANEVNVRLETSLAAAMKVLERRVGKLEVSSNQGTMGQDKGASNNLVERVNTSTTEAVEAKLVANKARDAAAKLDKALAMLATKLEMQNTGEGAFLHQKIAEMESRLAETQQAHMEGVVRMQQVLSELGVQVDLAGDTLKRRIGGRAADPVQESAVAGEGAYAILATLADTTEEVMAALADTDNSESTAGMAGSSEVDVMAALADVSYYAVVQDPSGHAVAGIITPEIAVIEPEAPQAEAVTLEPASAAAHAELAGGVASTQGKDAASTHAEPAGGAASTQGEGAAAAAAAGAGAAAGAAAASEGTT